jgi:hypothetical protein
MYLVCYNQTNANSLDPESVNPHSEGGFAPGYNTVIPKVCRQKLRQI